MILVKSYFKKVKGSDKYTFVCNLAEVDTQGNVSDSKSVAFEPKLAGDDREFYSPSLVFNNADGSIYFAGFMEIDRKKINGLYLLKYDYNSASLIYNKEYNFSDLMKPEIKKKTQVHYEIPEKVDQYYSLVMRRDDILLDNVNNFISLRIITDYGFNNTSFLGSAGCSWGNFPTICPAISPADIDPYSRAFLRVNSNKPDAFTLVCL